MKKTLLLICALVASITAMAQFGPTTAPTAPTDLTKNVVVVYSNYYGMGLADGLYGNMWGGGPVSPLWTTLDQPVIEGDRKALHVTGTAFSHRLTKYNDRNTWVTLDGNTTYNKVHVAVYPKTATTLYIYKDGGWGAADKMSVAVTPGQWNVVEQDVPATWTNNYYCVALMNGEAVETEFYMDDFYFSKPNVDDTEVPVLNTASLKSVGVANAVLTLKATDNISPTITYVITDQDSKVYKVEGANSTQIDYMISGLDNKEYTFSVVAQDESENASAAQNVVATPLALPESPAPDKPAADVLSIYSDAYTPAITWTDGEWEQTTVKTEKVVNENHILEFSKFNHFGFDNWSTQLDLSGMDYVHIDVLPIQNITLRITPIMTGGTPVENAITVGALTVGEWNSMDVKLSDFGLDFGNFKAFQIKIDNGHSTEVIYVDNIYFWKASAVDVTSLSIESATDEILFGKTVQLTVKNQADVEVPASQLTFASSSDAVATVNESGLVTGVAGGTATITVTSKTNPLVSETKEITVVGPTTAPAAPTGDVSVVYDGTTGTWSDQGWGWGSTQSNVTLGGKACRMGQNLGGMQIPNSLKTDYAAGGYTQLKVDVWSAYEHSLNVYFEGEGTNKAISLSIGWNEVVIPLEGIDATKVNYLTFQYQGTAPKDGILVFSNVYYAKGAVVVPFHITTDGVVTGDVSTANVDAINANTSVVIDLKGATITEDITITPANQNAVVVVGGTGRTPNESGAHVTAPNLIVFDGEYYRAKDGVVINLVDDNDAQPAYDFIIDAQQDGFAYTRTIAANAWVSYNSPATVNIPDGVTVYKATAATTGGVTFTKQVSQALGANDPVILHNTTDAPVVIASNNTKGDLNLTANPAGTDIATSGIIMHRTARAIEATGAEYALQDGKLKKFNAGAKIGAFRVYFTGLTGTEARAFFDDGDATGISNLTISSKSEKNEYYTLDGRKVSQPQKGLYIVNGKKVVIK